MSRKLFVGNLPYSVTSERLQEAFSQFGTVSSSKVIVDRETGRSRGFAFLEMETDDQGAAAMQAMNGALLDGRSIAVREAVERQPGGGGGGGGSVAAAVVAAATAAASVRAARVRPMAAAAVIAVAAVVAATAAAAVAVAIAAAVVVVATAVAAAAMAVAAAALPRCPGRSGDGGPMRDRRADFSGGPPPPQRRIRRRCRRRRHPATRVAAAVARPLRGGERDYEPRKRGFDDDQFESVEQTAD